MLISKAADYILIGIGGGLFFLSAMVGIPVSIKKKSKRLVRWTLATSLFGAVWAIAVYMFSPKVMVIDDVNGRQHLTELRDLGTFNNHHTRIVNHSAYDVRVVSATYSTSYFGSNDPPDTILAGTEEDFPHDIDYVPGDSLPSSVESKSDSETLYQLVFAPPPRK